MRAANALARLYIRPITGLLEPLWLKIVKDASLCLTVVKFVTFGPGLIREQILS